MFNPFESVGIYDSILGAEIFNLLEVDVDSSVAMDRDALTLREIMKHFNARQASAEEIIETIKEAVRSNQKEKNRLEAVLDFVQLQPKVDEEPIEQIEHESESN